MKRAIGMVMGAVFGIMFVARCGSPEYVVDMLSMDIGRLMDGGMNTDSSPSVDGMMAVTNAKAATSATAINCDKVRTTQKTGSGVSTTTTLWYAELSVPGLLARSANHITAIVCDPEYFGTTTDPSILECPAGYMCSDTGYSPSPVICQPGGLQITDGKITVTCGAKIKTSINYGTSSSTNEGGQHFKTAIIRID